MSREALKVLCLCLAIITALLILDDTDEAVKACLEGGRTLNKCNQLRE